MAINKDPFSELTVRELVVILRSLVDGVADEDLKDNDPIRWARLCIRLEKLVRKQHDKIFSFSVTHNIGSARTEKLQQFYSQLTSED